MDKGRAQGDSCFTAEVFDTCRSQGKIITFGCVSTDDPHQIPTNSSNPTRMALIEVNGSQINPKVVNFEKVLLGMGA